MSINAIWDTIKALAQSFQVGTVFPSALLVLFNVYIVLPRFTSEADASSMPSAVIISALVLMISYTLYAFNFPLIRFLEGYKLKGNFVSQRLLNVHTHRFLYLNSRIEELQTERELLESTSSGKNGEKLFLANPRWQNLNIELARLEREFDLDYPSNPDSVLASALGNTIAAFEDYPRLRYGIEPVVLWPRLIPVLKDNKHIDFVTQEKAVFDFLMNTGLVVTLLGMESCILLIGARHIGMGLVILALTLFCVLIFYRGTIAAAREWGTMVRVAFDLHRNELHKRLGLRDAKTFEEERINWQNISSFLGYRSGLSQFEGFIPQTTVNRKKKEIKNDD